MMGETWEWEIMNVYYFVETWPVQKKKPHKQT